jgi:hypothetical protein
MGKGPCSFLKIGRLFAQSACSCPTSRSSDIAAPAHGLNNIRVVKSTEVARVPSGEKKRRCSWLIRCRDVRIPAALFPSSRAYDGQHTASGELVTLCWKGRG